MELNTSKKIIEKEHVVMKERKDDKELNTMPLKEAKE